MRITVLGASGQIGSLVYEDLSRLHQVTGTSRKPHHGIIQFDPFTDDWSVLGTTDVLINCVGQIAATSKNSFHHIHVDLTKLIIAHRAKLGNPRIVQISALGASSNHQVEFLKTKGMADDLLLQHPNTTVIRPSIVCTHRTMIVKKMLMLSNLSRLFPGILPVPEGFSKTRIQPIMPQDLIDLVLQACVCDNLKIINAVGMEVLSFSEILHLLMKSSQRRFQVIEIARPVSDIIIKDMLSRLIPGVINEQQYRLLFEDNVANVGQCQRLLGKPPAPTRDFFEHEFHTTND